MKNTVVDTKYVFTTANFAYHLEANFINIPCSQSSDFALNPAIKFLIFYIG